MMSDSLLASARRLPAASAAKRRPQAGRTVEPLSTTSHGVSASSGRGIRADDQRAHARPPVSAAHRPRPRPTGPRRRRRRRRAPLPVTPAARDDLLRPPGRPPESGPGCAPMTSTAWVPIEPVEPSRVTVRTGRVSQRRHLSAPQPVGCPPGTPDGLRVRRGSAPALGPPPGAGRRRSGWAGPVRSSPSRTPKRSQKRTSGAGAHQFQRPSSRIVAGTSSARTIVASMTTATASPTPIIWMKLMPLVAKAPTTTTKSSAALVMMRPVRCSPRETASVVVPGAVPLLADAAQQEHLVVHREAERHREHQHRLRRLEGARRGESEQPLEVALLEPPDQDAERRRQRQHVHHDRLERQHDRPERQEEQHEGHDDDVAERPGQAVADPVQQVDQAGGLPRHRTSSAVATPRSRREPARRSRSAGRRRTWRPRVGERDHCGVARDRRHRPPR